VTRPGCLAFLLLDYVVPLASAWNMALISLDRYWSERSHVAMTMMMMLMKLDQCCRRYWSVARPIEYRLKMNTNVAVLCMAVPWLAGTVWYGPSVLLWETLSGRQAVPDGKCFVDFYDSVGYLIACPFLATVAERLAAKGTNYQFFGRLGRKTSTQSIN